ncbi:MAG: hypothetical protein PHF63_00785 [Herbinix sp.]|nr:hypothetical protein [Herbinix sp.]
MSILFNSNRDIDVSVNEALYTVENEGLILAHAEAIESTCSLMESLHEMDMAEITMNRSVDSNGVVLESAQAEYNVVMEASMAGAWKKIKEIFAAIKAKISAFFKNLKTRWKALRGDNEAFLSLYKDKLKKPASVRASYFVYDFSPVADAGKFMSGRKTAFSGLKGQNSDVTKKETAGIEKWKTEQENLRNKALAGFGFDVSNFKASIEKKYRSGDATAREKTVNLADQIANLKNDSDAKAIEEMEKTLKGFVESAEDVVEALSKGNTTETSALAWARAVLAETNVCYNKATVITSVGVRMIEERIRTARKLISKVAAASK